MHFEVTLINNFQYQCQFVYIENISLWDQRKKLLNCQLIRLKEKLLFPLYDEIRKIGMFLILNIP
jgi:hypothetical protein